MFVRTLKHVWRYGSSLLRERSKAKKRSSQWPALEHKTLAAHPTCAACGRRERLQVHHIQPYHLHPELELDPANLIVLCMGPEECHFHIGHGGAFKMANPNVVADAAEALAAPDKIIEIRARARANRKG